MASYSTLCTRRLAIICHNRNCNGRRTGTRTSLSKNSWNFATRIPRLVSLYNPEVVKELKRQTTEELEIEFHNAHKASEMYVDFQDECITKMLNMQREQSPRIPALPDSHLSSQSSAFAKFIPNNVPIFRFTK
jgi:hypothetical protein